VCGCVCGYVGVMAFAVRICVVGVLVCVGGFWCVLVCVCVGVRVWWRSTPGPARCLPRVNCFCEVIGEVCEGSVTHCICRLQKACDDKSAALQVCEWSVVMGWLCLLPPPPSLGCVCCICTAHQFACLSAGLVVCAHPACGVSVCRPCLIGVRTVGASVSTRHVSLSD